MPFIPGDDNEPVKVLSRCKISAFGLCLTEVECDTQRSNSILLAVCHPKPCLRRQAKSFMETLHMKRLSFIFFVLAFSWVVQPVGALSSDPNTLEESFKALQKDFDDISRSTNEVLKQKETEFQHKMEKYRQEMDVKVDDLESRLEKMTGDSEKQLRGFIQSLKEKNREMSDKAKQIIGSAKQELTRQLEKTITGLEKKIDEFKRQSENMGKDGREKLSRQLEVLRKKNRETMDTLERFKTEGVKTWDEIKSLISCLWQDLKNAYDRATKEPEVKKI